MNAPNRLVLRESDKQSPTWTRIERHLKERLEFLRMQNDGDSDATKTANTRGRIAELKLLLSAAEENPPPITSG